MREIKFRGKCVDSNYWVVGDLIINPENQYPQIGLHVVRGGNNVDEQESESYEFTDIKLDSVGQYTGLKDKNGKEIYKGDNVEVSEDCNGEIKKWTAEVAFKNGSFVLVNRDCCEHCKTGFSSICHLSETPGSIKIIGNIYQTK